MNIEKRLEGLLLRLLDTYRIFCCISDDDLSTWDTSPAGVVRALAQHERKRLNRTNTEINLINEKIALLARHAGMKFEQRDSSKTINLVKLDE